MNDLVSIITPAFNSELFIKDTIDSVLNQTHNNFEMIIVDDQSTDRTAEIVLEYSKRDSRVQYHKLTEKGGAAGARNYALKLAKGKYVAFLDADDLWDKHKLQKQIKFHKDYDVKFSYTGYRFVNERGEKTLRYRKSLKEISLNKLLFCSSAFGCLTVMYDRDTVGLIEIPLLKKRNDVALWQQVLQVVEKGYYLDEILASHRTVENSLSRSSKKSDLLKHHYNLYSENMKFGFVKSWFYSIMNALTYILVKIFLEKRGDL